MEKHQFSVTIDAPREKVWEILWNDATYPDWTAVFCAGSHAKSDWNKGSRVFFLDNKGDGMASTILEKIPNECMIFRNDGTVKGGIEDINPNNEFNKEWAGTTEAYTLHEKNGKTEITLDIDIVDDHLDFFMETIPKALHTLKQLAEGTKERLTLQ